MNHNIYLTISTIGINSKYLINMLLLPYSS